MPVEFSHLDSKLSAALIATIPAGDIREKVQAKRLQEVDSPDDNIESLTGAQIIKWISDGFRYTMSLRKQYSFKDVGK